jgi:hypothetical protein
MNLALAILFLWLGAALLFVAFHPLSLESAKGAPGDVIKSIRTAVQKEDNAYAASNS